MHPPGRGDGVKTRALRLSVLGVDAGGDNAVRLALPVRHFAAVRDDDVARLTRRIGADDTLYGHNLPDVGVLVLVDIEGDVGLVEVRVSLKEVLPAAGSPVRHAPVRRASHRAQAACGKARTVVKGGFEIGSRKRDEW